MLIQFKDSGWERVSVEDFGKAIDAKPSYTSNFAQSRRWAIESAVKELIEKDGWLIDWKPTKVGRQIVSLDFRFSVT